MKNIECIIIEKDDLIREGQLLWKNENYKEILYYHLKSNPYQLFLKAALVFLEKKDGSLDLMKNRYLIEL